MRFIFQIVTTRLPVESTPMMMIKPARCLIFIFFLLPFMVEASDDFQFRGDLKVTKEFRKGFDLSAEYQVRYYHNASEFHASYFSLQPQYNLNKHFTLEGEIRYATSPVWDKSRFGIGLSYKRSFGRWKPSLLAKYQWETYKQSIPEIGQFPATNNYRIKLELGYKAGHGLKPYLSCEPKYIVVQSDGFLSRIRYVGGVEYEFLKNHKLDVSYAIEPHYKTALSGTVYFLEVGYAWYIPKAKRKKEKSGS
jgi:hypothetical protein